MDEQLIETFEAYLLLSESTKEKKAFVEMSEEKRKPDAWLLLYLNKVVRCFERQMRIHWHSSSVNVFNYMSDMNFLASCALHSGDFLSVLFSNETNHLERKVCGNHAKLDIDGSSSLLCSIIRRNVDRIAQEDSNDHWLAQINWTDIELTWCKKEHSIVRIAAIVVVVSSSQQ